MPRLSLDEKELKQLLIVTKKMQQDFLDSSKKFQNELQEIVQESKNKRFTDILLKVFGDYNTWVGGVFKTNILDSWRNSADGLNAVAQKYHAGKQANDTAKKVSQQIEELSDVKNTFQPLNLPDTSTPILSAEYYDQMIAALKKYLESLDEKKDEIKRQLNQKKQENLLFECLVGVCEAIYTTAIAFWTQQKASIEKERENYIANTQKKQKDTENLAKTMMAAAGGIAVGHMLNPEKMTATGGGNDASDGGEQGAGGSTVAGAAAQEPSAVKEPYASRLREFMERFQKQPEMVQVFHDLASYMYELANDLTQDVYVDADIADLLRKIMIIAESYLLFGGGGFEFSKGEDSWKYRVDYTYYSIFANQYEDCFRGNDFSIYRDSPYEPKNYDTISRMIQNLCGQQGEPDDILLVTEFFVEILNEQLHLTEDKRKEYPNFSHLAVEQIQEILNGEEIRAENVGAYGELAEAAVNLQAPTFKAFRELTKKIYDMVANDMAETVPRVSPQMIVQLMPIYEEFYQRFGSALQVNTQPMSLESFGEQELVNVTVERANTDFFENGEWNIYQVAARCGDAQKYDTAARMEKNIASAYESQNARIMNLVYGMYVVFIPIMKGTLNIADSSFFEYSKEASDKILKILGQETPSQTELTEENSKEWMDKIVEAAEEAGGIDELNATLEDANVLNFYTGKNAAEEELTKPAQTEKKPTKLKAEKQTSGKTKRGRYAVDDELIECIKEQRIPVLAGLDNFHSRVALLDHQSSDLFLKSSKSQKKMQKVHTFIEKAGSIFTSWAKVLFPEEESSDQKNEGASSGNLLVRGALFAYANGNLLTATAIKAATQITDFLSQTDHQAGKLSKNVLQASMYQMQQPQGCYIANYMAQHYQIKMCGGMQKAKEELYLQTGGFDWIHVVCADMDDRGLRNWYEAASFWADNIVSQIAYRNNKELLGEGMILMVAALISTEMYSEDEVVRLVDILYEYYKDDWGVLADTSVNPLDRHGVRKINKKE